MHHLLVFSNPRKSKRPETGSRAAMVSWPTAVAITSSIALLLGLFLQIPDPFCKMRLSIACSKASAEKRTWKEPWMWSSEWKS
jgi:hypothetical protein